MQVSILNLIIVPLFIVSSSRDHLILSVIRFEVLMVWDVTTRARVEFGLRADVTESCRLERRGLLRSVVFGLETFEVVLAWTDHGGLAVG
jgi:hypothetical protein